MGMIILENDSREANEMDLITARGYFNSIVDRIRYADVEYEKIELIEIKSNFTEKLKHVFEDKGYSYYDGTVNSECQRHGCGRYVQGDGYSYDGEFKNDFYDGYGILTLPNGSMKEGYFKEGKFVGKSDC